jgi:acyl-CoA synthetase (AMP-forming)/AMP-acid ligase II
MRRGDVLVSWVPPWHDLGLVHFIVGPVYFGVSCHIVTPSVRTIPDWLRTISEVGGTWSGAPDFVYRIACRMVAAGDVDLRSLRHCVNGGEPVRWSSIQDFERRFSVSGVVMPGYGLGETTLGVSAHLPGDEIKVDERGNVSCGRPIGGIEVVAGSSVAEPAEIRVRGDTVFAGYLDAPQDTSSALRDGWLHTGDIGYLDADRLLFVLGRRRAMIKRAGAPIAPRELEEAALRVPAVRIAAAASVPGDHPGEDTIVVAVETASSDLSHDEISAAVYREVAADLGFGPDRVVLVAPRTIPRSENGKIRHPELADVLRHQFPAT